MVPERLQQQIDFLLEIDKLKGIVRRSYVMGGARRENTAEHSWHLVMMALVLTEHADQPVDALAVLQMLAVHDLVEIDAGDTYVFDTDGGSSKANGSRPPPIGSSPCCRPTRVPRCGPAGRSSKPATAPRPASPAPSTG